MNDIILENFLAAWNRFAWYLDTQDFCQNSPASETQNNLKTTSESSKKSFPGICGPLSSILHEHVPLRIVATMRAMSRSSSPDRLTIQWKASPWLKKMSWLFVHPRIPLSIRIAWFWAMVLGWLHKFCTLFFTRTHLRFSCTLFWGHICSRRKPSMFFFCLVVGLLWFAFWMIGNWFIAFWVVYTKVKFESISQVCVTNLFS